MDHAEIYCLTLMSRRASAMACYLAVFGFMILMLSDPDYLDEFQAAVLTGFYALISLYYLVNSVAFLRPRFTYASAGIADDTTRRQLRREHDFRRGAHACFIFLSFLYVLYLGV